MAGIHQKKAIWIDCGKTIHMSFYAPYTRGAKWINIFNNAHSRRLVSNHAADVLCSKDFVRHPISDTKIEVVIMKSYNLKKRTPEIVRACAQKEGWVTPTTDIGCLIRYHLYSGDMERMGLNWIVTMHEPVLDSAGVPRQLSSCHESGALRGSRGYPDYQFEDELTGFAFIRPPKK